MKCNNVEFGPNAIAIAMKHFCLEVNELVDGLELLKSLQTDAGRERMKASFDWTYACILSVRQAMLADGQVADLDDEAIAGMILKRVEDQKAKSVLHLIIEQ